MDGSEGYQSLRLVTASYHMPRSIQEFHHHMPQVRIVPHAVFLSSSKGNGGGDGRGQPA